MLPPNFEKPTLNIASNLAATARRKASASHVHVEALVRLRSAGEAAEEGTPQQKATNYYSFGTAPAPGRTRGDRRGYGTGENVGKARIPNAVRGQEYQLKKSTGADSKLGKATR